jgi:hypothetical protein
LIHFLYDADCRSSEEGCDAEMGHATAAGGSVIDPGVRRSLEPVTNNYSRQSPWYLHQDRVVEGVSGTSPDSARLVRDERAAVTSILLKHHATHYDTQGPVFGQLGRRFVTCVTSAPAAHEGRHHSYRGDHRPT